MKTKGILAVLAIISMLALMVLLSSENLYVALALILGFLLLGHRELWSLIRHRRMPVIDERVQHNLTGAMRFTGVFFFISSAVLILLLHFNVFKETATSLVISGQLILIGIIYVISYHYYDRVQPVLKERSIKTLIFCLMTAGISLGVIALSITLHNMIYVWFNLEEAVFFILGIIVAPAVCTLSLLTSFGIFLTGLLVSFSGAGRE